MKNHNKPPALQGALINTKRYPKGSRSVPSVSGKIAMDRYRLLELFASQAFDGVGQRRPDTLVANRQQGNEYGACSRQAEYPPG